MFFVHVTENSTPDAYKIRLPKHTDLLSFHNAAAMMLSLHDDAYSAILGTRTHITVAFFKNALHHQVLQFQALYSLGTLLENKRN